MRIDKWLWAARFYKTRGAATEAVLGGLVQLNGARVKPAKDVAVGDRVEVRLGQVQRTVVVTGLAEKRGPAKVAATLYEETTESREARERLAYQLKNAPTLQFTGGGRPTKRDRRVIERLRRGG